MTIEQWRRHAEGFSWQTFTFSAQWEDAGGQRRSRGFAVRREPEDGLLAPYDIEGQYALHEHLEKCGSIPVPPLLWLERDPRALGMPFYVMERVDGHVPVPWDPADPVLSSERSRRILGLSFVDVLAGIHSMPIDGSLPPLARPSRPQRAGLEALELWYSAYERAARSRLPLVEAAASWLRRNPHSSGCLCLCHGDYRVGNVMVDQTMQINAVFDWELAHIGDPVSDIAWAALRLFRGRSPRWSHLLEESEFLARYRERTGILVDRQVLAFWTTVSCLKAIANHLRAAQAFEQGRAGDLRLAAMGHQVVFLLRLLREHLHEQRAL